MTPQEVVRAAASTAQLFLIVVCAIGFLATIALALRAAR